MTITAKLYIPESITVGFQKRTDTFTGQLAYIIYTDHTGKLRKETSWNAWRNKDIAPVTVPNVPTAGFVFNKGVERDGYWGSGRSMIRVWDPRNFEFEIDVDNTMGILMHSDVNTREIQQQCVYAWNGTSLVLLPVNSVEYQASVTHTAKQSMKVSAKSLVIGHTYEVKKTHERVVYLGKLPYYDDDTAVEEVRDSSSWYGRYTATTARTHALKPAKHTFITEDGDRVERRDPTQYLSQCISEEVHRDVNTLFEKYYRTAESQAISRIVVQPLSNPVRMYGSTTLLCEISENVIARMHFTRGSSGNMVGSLVGVAVFNPETQITSIATIRSTGGPSVIPDACQQAVAQARTRMHELSQPENQSLLASLWSQPPDYHTPIALAPDALELLTQMGIGTRVEYQLSNGQISLKTTYLF